MEHFDLLLGIYLTQTDCVHGFDDLCHLKVVNVPLLMIDFAT